MKYFIPSIFIFVSCSNISIDTTDIPTVDSYGQACAWVSNNILYVSDHKTYIGHDDWKLASETLRDGYGDCEDMAILFLELCRANGLGDGDLFVQYIPSMD